jgi:proline iminopeptidase
LPTPAKIINEMMLMPRTKRFTSRGIYIKSLQLTFLLFLFISSASSQPSDSLRSNGFVRVQNAQLYYETIGVGEPIVILHGGPGLDHTYLLPQMNSLATKFQLIYYDQRATGKSSGIVDSASITPDQFVEDLETLRKALGIERMNLLGHSWGGLLAMHYGIKYPNRLKSLILVSSVGASSEWLAPFLKTRAQRTTWEDSLAMANLLSSVTFAKYEPQAMSAFTRLTFSTYFFNRAYLDSLNFNLSQNTASHFLPVFGLMNRFLADYNLILKLSVIHCPTLILHGDYDPVSAEYTKKLSQYLKNSRFVLIENCGHFPFVECHDHFTNICLEFLREASR